MPGAPPPAGWPGYEITYRYGLATYAICVHNDGSSGGDPSCNMTVDGKRLPGNLPTLHVDVEVHQVQIALQIGRLDVAAHGVGWPLPRAGRILQVGSGHDADRAPNSAQVASPT